MAIFIVPSNETPTINSAVEKASPGDTIEILEGTYFENVIVDKNDITIQSADKEEVTITGFEQSGIGIDISGVTGVLIQNINVTNFSIGIFLRGDENTLINLSSVSNAVYGILLRGNQNKIEDCILNFNNASGLNMSGMENIIVNNICDENKLGGIINTEGSAFRNLIEKNSVVDSEVGIGWLAQNSTDNIFCKNILSKNDFAIVITDDKNTLTRNIIKDQRLDGVDILGDENKFTNNLITNSNVGLTIVGDKNEITNNVIIGNNLADIIDLGEENKLNSNSAEKVI